MTTPTSNQLLRENERLRQEVDDLRRQLDAHGRVESASKTARDITEGNGHVTLLAESERRFREMIDALPAAIYTTDAQGRLTHFNPAAVELSGRVPELGNDRWCVTWKLYYPDGRPMPHHECPMAVALKEGRIVSGVETIAERPDGTRVWFAPYPRLLRDAGGRVVGGVNMLVDITERKRTEEALRQAHAELQSHAEELARFNRAAVNGELRVIELKQEINALCERLGESPRYSPDYEPAKAEASPVSRLPGEEGDGLVPLESVLCTEELKHRPMRPPDYESQTRALAALVQALADSPSTILQTLADTTVDVLRAESAGLSLLTGDGKRFYWAAIAGAWAPHRGGGTPREFGPCGDVLNCNAPLLFTHWEKRYPYLSAATPLAEEGLLVPFFVGGKAVGTIWAIAHSATRRFDAEDLRLLESLAHFASAAYQAVEFLGAVDQRRAALSLMEDAIQARHAIAASEARLRQLADAMPQIVWAAEPDGYLDYYNERWYEYTGFPRGEYGQASWERILHPDDVQRCVETYFGCIKAGTPYQIEYRFKDRRTGGYRWFLGRAMPVRDESGRIVRWFGTCTDINDTKQAQEALKEANRRKDEFLATLAHELRNPLAPIRNAAQVLSMKDLADPQLRRARDIIDRQVQQMVRLIDDLLDVSRITSGKLQLRRERLELAAVVQSAVEASRPLIDAQAHDLTVSLPAEPVYLEADPIRLAQVFSNLLNNAAKYTEKGGHVWLAAERRDGELVVSVRDTGIGIAAEHLPQLFEMFSQVTPALERSQGGLGIGLALVRGLVSLHGGSVEAHSAGLGRGSEFIVRLPVIDTPTQRRSELSADGEKPPPGPTYRILVADDLQDSVDSLAMMLRLAGHDIQTAHDGLEAVQAAATFRPDVVLLDIGMPKMNGYEAARYIRQQPWGKDMLLVALTGWGQEEDKRRASEAGFNRHWTKPVDPAALERLLAELAPATA